MDIFMRKIKEMDIQSSASNHIAGTIFELSDPCLFVSMILIHNAKVLNNMKTGIANPQFSNAPVPMSMIEIYSALPIYHSLFSPNNSWETLIACPTGGGMGVFHEIWSDQSITFECSVLCSVLCYMVPQYISRIYSIMSAKFVYC